MKSILQAPRTRRIAGALINAFSEDSGQDLVEYALLVGFLAFAGYLVLTALGVDIFQTYQAWLDPTTGTPSLWDPPPASGGS